MTIIGDIKEHFTHDVSLVRSFLKVLANEGLSTALSHAAKRLWVVFVPVAEVVMLTGVVYVLYVAAKHKELKKHSALIDGRVSKDREAPRDIMKPFFFQNKQNLWLHHDLWWNGPKEDCKGVLVFLHGHSEHSKRFIHVAEHFNAKGFAMFAMDHQGFGRSEGDRGYVELFEHYVDDVLDFLKQVVYEDHPEWQHLPRFLGGHSMGSLIAIHSTLRCQASDHPAHKLTGVMLNAPAVHVDPSRNTWYLRAAGKVLDFFAPKAAIIGFPTYPSTSFLQVKLHATFDPLNYHGAIRVHQGLEMLKGTRMALEMAPMFSTPILIVHGVDDMHADISGSREFMSLIQSTDKTLHELVGLKHEPYQEEKHIRDAVLDVVVDWAIDRLDGKPKEVNDLKSKLEFHCKRDKDGNEISYTCDRSSPTEDFVKL